MINRLIAFLWRALCWLDGPPLTETEINELVDARMREYQRLTREETP
jgi:hypothetical protein